MSPVIVAVAGVVVLLVLLALVVITRYKVAGPNEAFIITGRRGKKSIDPETGQVSIDNSGQKVVVGGGVFVVPFVQQKFSSTCPAGTSRSPSGVPSPCAG